MNEYLVVGLIAWNVMLSMHLYKVNKKLTDTVDMLHATCRLIRLGLDIGFDELTKVNNEEKDDGGDI